MTIHFVLPGYAPRAVGGYRVVYDYALAIQRSTGERVVISHSPWTILRHPQTVSLRAFAGILARAARIVMDHPASRGIPWYRETRELDLRFSFFGPKVSATRGDVVVATSAHTAPFVSRLKTSAAKAHFIQHVEKWSAPPAFIEETWKLPLHRITIAPWLVDYAVSLGSASALVPNAIDGVDFPPGPPLSARPRRVVAMISPLPFKRADILVEVFSRAKAIEPSAEFHAFGVEPRPRNLPPFVEYHWNPSRSELAELYAGSRVYVCASDAEGWHLPPGEALMSGTAVASTDIGGVRVVAGDAALYSPVGDANALLASVLQLLRDPALAQQLASRGQARLMAYSPSEAAAAFLRELDSLR